MMPPLMNSAASPSSPSRPARLTRLATLAALFALVALGLAWELWLAPLRPGGSWWALKVLPLLTALPGVLRYRMRTYRWLALLVWLYFVEGTVRGASDVSGTSAILAWLQTAGAVLLFAACTAHIRLRLRTARGSHHNIKSTPTP